MRTTVGPCARETTGATANDGVLAHLPSPKIYPTSTEAKPRLRAVALIVVASLVPGMSRGF